MSSNVFFLQSKQSGEFWMKNKHWYYIISLHPSEITSKKDIAAFCIDKYENMLLYKKYSKCLGYTDCIDYECITNIILKFLYLQSII